MIVLRAASPLCSPGSAEARQEGVRLHTRYSPPVAVYCSPPRTTARRRWHQEEVRPESCVGTPSSLPILRASFVGASSDHRFSSGGGWAVATTPMIIITDAGYCVAVTAAQRNRRFERRGLGCTRYST